MMISDEIYQKLNRLAAACKQLAILTDTPRDSSASGMNLPLEAESLHRVSETLREDMFSVLVMAKFKSGKSTLINAMAGKELMKTKTTPCTAAITYIRYGQENDIIEVYHEDSRSPERMSSEEFSEKYTLTDEEAESMLCDEYLDKFDNISHTVIYDDSDFFKNGLMLIDTPGMEEKYSRIKIKTEILPKASAIVFTMSAVSLFSQGEREYIADNFAGKSMKDVFFVVNRINQVYEHEVEKVKQVVRKELHDVFVDKNGVFDEELYQKRVFFVDAYTAECARLGKNIRVVAGKKEFEYPAEIEDSGVPEFEEALQEFLNSEERIYPFFSSTIRMMAGTYHTALQMAEAYQEFRSLQFQEENADITSLIASNRYMNQQFATVAKMKNLIDTAYQEFTEKKLSNAEFSALFECK